MGQQLGVVEQCGEAIEALFRARSLFEGTGYEELIKARFQGDAACLATNGGKGLYYGKLDSGLRLCLIRGEFHLGGGIMHYQDFRRLQELFIQECKTRGLKFYKMLDNQAERHITCPATLVVPPT